MRPVHRRPPRVLVRQFAVWLTWFLLSGYVFHGRTARDIHELSVLEVGFRLLSLAIVLVVAYWFFVVMPANVRGFLSTAAAIGLTLGGLPILVQTSVTKYLELRQTWP